ncbi:uncharacterized protein [Diadema setosum]|uniref:uncharacterized protein n=1 Tax=Diadema setosum TaxID=31175 RepID=UPI003B3BB598
MGWGKWDALTDLLHETRVMIYSLGTSLCVAVALLVVLAMTRCKNQERTRRKSESLNQMNDRSDDGQIHMNPPDTSRQNPSTSSNADSPNATIAPSGAVGHSVSDNPNIRFVHISTHQEDPYHIYEDAGSAVVDKGRSQIDDVEQISSCIYPIESSVKSAVSTSLTSIVMPSCSEYCGIQETSFDQTLGGCKDWEYQDVNSYIKGTMTADGVDTPSLARLFDCSSYNSLTFCKTSDGVCAPKRNANPCNRHIHEGRVVDTSNLSGTMLSEYAELSDTNEDAQIIFSNQEYNHINHAPHENRAQRSYNPALLSSSYITKRKAYSDKEKTALCTRIDSLTAKPFEDVLHYKLDPAQRNEIDISNEPQYSDAFDSEEYSVLNPQDNGNDIPSPIMRENDLDSEHHEIDNMVCFPSESKTCEELYAKVDKTGGVSSTASSPHEELYAKVDKAIGASSAASPPSEELYAEVDKTRGTWSHDSQAAWQEELYMNISDK